MGKIIEKGTEKLLAEFSDEETGKRLKAEFREAGKQIKVEW